MWTNFMEGVLDELEDGEKGWRVRDYSCDAGTAVFTAPDGRRVDLISAELEEYAASVVRKKWNLVGVNQWRVAEEMRGWSK